MSWVMPSSVTSFSEGRAPFTCAAGLQLKLSAVAGVTSIIHLVDLQRTLCSLQLRAISGESSV